MFPPAPPPSSTPAPGMFNVPLPSSTGGSQTQGQGGFGEYLTNLWGAIRGTKTPNLGTVGQAIINPIAKKYSYQITSADKELGMIGLAQKLGVPPQDLINSNSGMKTLSTGTYLNLPSGLNKVPSGAVENPPDPYANPNGLNLATRIGAPIQGASAQADLNPVHRPDYAQIYGGYEGQPLGAYTQGQYQNEISKVPVINGNPDLSSTTNISEGAAQMLPGYTPANMQALGFTLQNGEWINTNLQKNNTVNPPAPDRNEDYFRMGGSTGAMTQQQYRWFVNGYRNMGSGRARRPMNNAAAAPQTVLNTILSSGG